MQAHPLTTRQPRGAWPALQARRFLSTALSMLAQPPSRHPMVVCRPQARPFPSRPRGEERRGSFAATLSILAPGRQASCGRGEAERRRCDSLQGAGAFVEDAGLSPLHYHGEPKPLGDAALRSNEMRLCAVATLFMEGRPLGLLGG